VSKSSHTWLVGSHLFLVYSEGRRFEFTNITDGPTSPEKASSEEHLFDGEFLW
jgi:hypothetical protein